MRKKFDFAGWATKFNLLCADGRTIRKGAFDGNNGKEVPLVWNHTHGGPENVLGHAVLESREDGMYAYCSFNDTENANIAKSLVEHGDIQSLSIYANHLKQSGGDVLHGIIREVSLVLAGANPGASIDYVNLAHSDSEDSDAIIKMSEQEFIMHGDYDLSEADPEEVIEHADEKEEPKEEKKEVAEANEKTVQDVIDEMTEEQKNVMYAIVGKALEEAGANKEEGDDEMGHSVFENEMEGDVLTHADMEEIIKDGKRLGSLKESVLQHGIEHIDYLFPDAKAVNNQPEFIKRPDDWVSKVMSGVHHTPFSRIKSIFADITEDAARAKGYIKGKLKKEEVFGLLKRTTTPTTIYKKQKLDRDDVIDITDFDVIAWLKSEMRMMLDEEIARAILIGDGRLASDDDKINEQCIRPIYTDADLFTIKKIVKVDANANDDVIAKAFIRNCVLARKDYRGSGTPTLYTTEDMLTKCLLLEDTTGRVIYDTEEKLRTALRVKEIVTVPVMENVTRTDDTEGTVSLMGIIVNLADYTVGADKGGAVSMFDDFDIDYNAQKYLIETRCSGALTKPFSAIALDLAFKTA